MRLLLLFSAALAAVLFSASAIAGDGELPCASTLPAATQFSAQSSELAGAGPAALAGRRIRVEVDLAASAAFELAADGRVRYGMGFNDVAEGWSWQPQASAQDEDYYRWKFLPLQSVSEEREAYVQEEMVGVPQRTRVEWRYDYFLAFDNPYEFYRRGDAGFVMPLADGAERPSPDKLRLVALARLSENPLSESTTFWKAVHARPVDFTLKKRYFVGRLDALVLCDADAQQELSRIGPAGLSQR